jgi:superoxide dismutase, Cu-Zn family
MKIEFWLSVCAASALLAGCGQREKPADTAEVPGTPSAPAPAPAEAPPPTAGASVQLSPTQGNSAAGTLNLVAEGNSVRVTGTLQNLSPNGEFGFHIHENGDCSAPDASSAGAHFNPTSAQHGNPQGEIHHAGDMLNAKSDAQGMAMVDAVASGVSIDSGQPNSVRGKAIVLHEKADDYASQPAGNSGARIACGVIN